MTDTQTVEISLSKGQRQSLNSAYHSKKSTVLRLTTKQLHGDSDKLLVTPSQHKKITKKRAANEGIELLVTYSRLSKMAKTKEGGFAWMIPLALAAASGLTGALGSSAGKKLGKKIFGDGLILPGTTMHKKEKP